MVKNFTHHPKSSTLSPNKSPRDKQRLAGRRELVATRQDATQAVSLDESLLAENPNLQQLFNRVNELLNDPLMDPERFVPRCGNSLQEMGLTTDDIQRLVFKYLLQKGAASGREICAQIKVPFRIIFPLLSEWKNEQLITYRSAGEMGDYVFAIMDSGREFAYKFQEECSYFGPAPVSLTDYVDAIERQSVADRIVTEKDVKVAFDDLLVDDAMFNRLGPAINSGRGMFLYGEPGNGKSSIAERVTRCFGDTIWIPRAIGIDGEIIRLFDSRIHQECDDDSSQSVGLLDNSGIDHRWVQIVRPTVMVGGELTMSQLELTFNPITKISEAPLQLKSNGGTLVIDDFGRQTMPVDVLLNRWIVPLEKRFDFLNLPSGKKIQVPFDQLIIFSTNLEPKNLVDGAFLRRIPYKIEVKDPSEAHFRELFQIVASKMGLELPEDSLDHLILNYYLEKERPFRSCHPRDLLLQVKNYCSYRGQPCKVTTDSIDFAVETYFSVT